ncbi:MAG: hypothetical protein B7Y45_10760 [Sphingomonas sp. 28-66-16]|nr:MAG: hypothetical protein B7Y45_10760 [Sphingomonas sp. 28-66-16]
MLRTRIASAPGNGRSVARAALALLALASTLAPTAAREPRLPYPAIPTDRTVTLRLPTSHPPRLGYPPLPIDDRIAPDDFAMDDDTTEPLTPDQRRQIEAKLALLQLSQNYRPNPAIWKIADRDTTIYLFGTIHVLPPGFQWRSAALERIVARAGTLLTESVDDGTDLDQMLASGRATGPITPLIDRVSASHRRALADFKRTLPPEAATLLDGMPTWIAAAAISVAKDIRAGETPGPGADDWIEARFRESRKPVVPIEDARQVLAKVSAIPEADQRRMLDAALDAPVPVRAERRAPIHAWAKGDVGPDSPLTIDITTTTGSSALAGPLLDERNRAWTDALIRRLRTPGVVLFAAGAGHFIGNGSVIDLLRRRGITVSRVQ